MCVDPWGTFIWNVLIGIAVGGFWGKVRSFSFKKLINGEYFADVLKGFSYLFSQTSQQSFKDAKNTVIGIFKGSIFDWIETIFT